MSRMNAPNASEFERVVVGRGPTPEQRAAWDKLRREGIPADDWLRSPLPATAVVTEAEEAANLARVGDAVVCLVGVAIAVVGFAAGLLVAFVVALITG
jgi:hypothetical protein